MKQTVNGRTRRATRGMGVWCWNSPRKLRQMCIVCATWSAVQGLALSSVSKAVRLIKKYPKKYLLRSPISTSSTRPRPHCPAGGGRIRPCPTSSEQRAPKHRKRGDFNNVDFLGSSLISDMTRRRAWDVTVGVWGADLRSNMSI